MTPSKHSPHLSGASTALALGAIVLWGSLAPLGVLLQHLPPFLLTGLGLLVGSLIAVPLSGGKLAALRVPLRTLALGVYGLFGFPLSCCLLLCAMRRRCRPIWSTTCGPWVLC
jgi:hypothetical protein